MKIALKTLSPKLKLNESSNELFVLKNGQEEKIKIEPISTKLLLKLCNHQNQVVSREDFIESIWEGNYGVGDKALTKNIYKLRNILLPYQLDHIIETIPKKGYRLKIERAFRLQKSKILFWAGVFILTAVFINIAFPGLFHYIFHRIFHF